MSEILNKIYPAWRTLKKMKGKLLEVVLEAIGETGINIAQLIEVICTAPYGSSLRRMEMQLELRKQRRSSASPHSNRRYSDVIYRLRKNDLINFDRKRKLFQLTPRGTDKLKNLKSAAGLPDASGFRTQPAGEYVLIIFDIPESQRRKRDWLRQAIRKLKFKMLQKSVWLGKTKIPPEFIRALKEAQILDYVDILAITKTGSVKQLA